jgi:hypothetical protein
MTSATMTIASQGVEGARNQASPVESVEMTA